MYIYFNIVDNGPAALMIWPNHTFETKGLKRRNCVGCYNKLRAMSFTSRESQRKTKKIKSYCLQCKRHYCAKCFYENHLYGLL